MPVASVGNRPVSRLTVDVEPPFLDLINRKLETLRPKGGQPLPVTRIARSLIGSWERGELPTPKTLKRFTVDIAQGSYAVFDERLRRENESRESEGRKKLIRERRLSKERLLRGLMWSWVVGEYEPGAANGNGNRGGGGA